MSDLLTDTSGQSAYEKRMAEYRRRADALRAAGIKVDESIEEALDEVAQAEIVVNGKWVDEGIGSYEYWGAKGVHHDWRVETSAKGPATLEVSGVLAEYAPPEEDETSVGVTIYVQGARGGRRHRHRYGDDYDGYDEGEPMTITIALRLCSCSMVRNTVEHEGESLTYWHYTCEYEWAEGEVE